jgi:hypothetical protein
MNEALDLIPSTATKNKNRNKINNKNLEIEQNKHSKTVKKKIIKADIIPI